MNVLLKKVIVKSKSESCLAVLMMQKRVEVCSLRIWSLLFSIALALRSKLVTWPLNGLWIWNRFAILMNLQYIKRSLTKIKNTVWLKPFIVVCPYLRRKYDQQKFAIYIKHQKCALRVDEVLCITSYTYNIEEYN